jgi:iron complex transport system substrate-binding protein
MSAQPLRTPPGRRAPAAALAPLLLALALALAAGPSPALARTVTDMAGRAVDIPERVERVICSGAGCLRLLTYLQAQGMAVAVDSVELRETAIETRPYGIANPQFKALPLFGELRGRDNPELIVGLDPAPQVIFKVMIAGESLDPDQLQAKTGIPVVVLEYGNLSAGRPLLDAALRLMGEVVHRAGRAEEVVALFDSWQADLAARTAGIPEDRRPWCYVGGISMKGTHGMQSTEPTYPPFRMAGARNVAHTQATEGRDQVRTGVPKEQIVAWDPEVLFLDVSSTSMGEDAGGLHELRTDPALSMLRAVRAGEVYGVLPYNSYHTNYGSIFANAYFVGKILHPGRFADVDPAATADAIYTALVGQPVFGRISRSFPGLVFARVPLR